MTLALLLTRFPCLFFLSLFPPAPPLALFFPHSLSLSLSLSPLPSGEEKGEGVERYSLSNVASGSNLMWAHLISAYFFGGIVLFEVEGLCKRYERYRRRYLSMPRPRNFAVLVRDLPPELNEEETIHKHFASSEASVHGLARVRKVDELKKCSTKRQKALRYLGRAEYARDEREAPEGVEPAAAYAVGAPPSSLGSSKRGPLLKRMCCRSQKKLAASQESYEGLVERLNAQVCRTWR